MTPLFWVLTPCLKGHGDCRKPSLKTVPPDQGLGFWLWSCGARCLFGTANRSLKLEAGLFQQRTHATRNSAGNPSSHFEGLRCGSGVFSSRRSLRILAKHHVRAIYVRNTYWRVFPHEHLLPYLFIWLCVKVFGPNL